MNALAKRPLLILVRKRQHSSSSLLFVQRCQHLTRSSRRHQHATTISSRTITSTTTTAQRQEPHHHRPLSLGYMAGLQYTSPETPWNTYNEAYDILQHVDDMVLKEFEEDLWNSNGIRFIHSTKQVSVMDIDYNKQEDSSNSDIVMRLLVLNERPHLIQSSVEIDHVGATGPKAFGAPPPLRGVAATHLGGLAIAAPLWYYYYNNAAVGTTTIPTPSSSSITKPTILVLGAGGCTIPAVLAATCGCQVTAVEPDDDVRTAAQSYFGVVNNDMMIDLVAGYGEDYLEGISNNNNNKLIDILVLDAEDESLAPPESMRQKSFWKNLVAPSLAPNAVVAVNMIDDERVAFQQTVQEGLSKNNDYNVWYCEVPKVAEVSNRHAILFATPKQGMETTTTIMRETLLLHKYVDEPEEWLEEIEKATKGLP